MSDPDFLLDDRGVPLDCNDKMDAFILNLLSKNKKINTVDMAIVLREKYETFFNIFNHDGLDPKRGLNGLALVSMHPAENLAENEFRRDLLMKKFVSHKVHQYFGCSWMEFIKQEWSEVERMFNTLEPIMTAESNQISKAQNEINQLSRQL